MRAGFRPTGSFVFSMVLAVAASAATAIAPPPASAQANGSSGTESRSVQSGVYTNDQAKAGETVFRQTCGNCHPTSEFAGTPFQRTWHGKAVFTFFDQVRLMMPLDNPGGLSDEEYVNVIAYILKLNEYPAGETALPLEPAALKTILFEQRTGSQQ